MGEMSSIVSRRPEVCRDAGSRGSPMNQRKEAFWMSIRLGTSRTFSSLENDRRTLGAVISGKAALLPRGTKGMKGGWTGQTAQPRRVSAETDSRKRVDAGAALSRGRQQGHYIEASRECKRWRAKRPASADVRRAVPHYTHPS